MHMIETDESTVRNTQYCGNLTEDYIRAAHIFNNTVDQVRQNFAITGLLSEIQVGDLILFLQLFIDKWFFFLLHI